MKNVFLSCTTDIKKKVELSQRDRGRGRERERERERERGGTVSFFETIVCNNSDFSSRLRNMEPAGTVRVALIISAIIEIQEPS